MVPPVCRDGPLLARRLCALLRPRLCDIAQRRRRLNVLRLQVHPLCAHLPRGPPGLSPRLCARGGAAGGAQGGNGPHHRRCGRLSARHARPRPARPRRGWPRACPLPLARRQVCRLCRFRARLPPPGRHLPDQPLRLGHRGGKRLCPTRHHARAALRLRAPLCGAGRPRRHRRRDRGLRNGAAAGGALGGDSRGRRLRAHGPIYCAVVGCRFDRSRSCDLWARPNPSANRELRKRTNWHFAELSSMIRSASPR
mmetsp:Transcript_22213/g.72817  ORF Transcript_22213/g.72817 Transcript_22213/m.72817 type:complete len:253 (+) Transcript_22213:961-1719(+)